MKSVIKLIINLLIATIYTVGTFLYPRTVPSEFLVGGVHLGLGLMLLFIAFILGILTESLWKFIYPVIATGCFFGSMIDPFLRTGLFGVFELPVAIIIVTFIGLIAGSAIRQGAVRVVEYFE